MAIQEDHQQDQELYLPLHCIIPLEIREDGDIPAEAKIYFGELNVLTNKFGYCWASDESLAKMKNVSKSTIERWHLILEKKGYIWRDTQNIPIKQEDQSFLWQRKRKIYVGKEFSKKVCGTPKNEGTIGTPKNEGRNIQPLNSEQKKTTTGAAAPNPAVVVSSLNQLDLTEDLKREISKTHSQEKIDVVVGRCLRWKTRKSDAAAIRWLLDNYDSYEEPSSDEDIVEENTKHLKKFAELDGKKIGQCSIIVGNTYVEFTCGNKVEQIGIHLKDFKIRVLDHIELINKQVKKNERTRK